MLNVGGPELLIILLVALIFLGPQRLPDVARQLGQTVSSLRSLASGFQAEIDAASKPIKEAIKPVDDSMTLDGPTDQAEAIQKTQTDPFAGSQKDPFAPAKPTSRTDIDHVINPDADKTDVEALAKAAREVEYDDDEDGEAQGGPTDLRDEEE